MFFFEELSCRGNIPLFLSNTIPFLADSNAVALCSFVKRNSSFFSKSTNLFSNNPSLNFAVKILRHASFTRSIESLPSSTEAIIASVNFGPCICISIPASTDK